MKKPSRLFCYQYAYLNRGFWKSVKSSYTSASIPISTPAAAASRSRFLFRQISNARRPNVRAIWAAAHERMTLHPV